MNKKYFLLSLYLCAFLSITTITKCVSKKPTVVILMHLYNIYLLDECITRINKCIAANNSFNFYIKINIPVASNIESFGKAIEQKNLSPKEQKNIYQHCLKHAYYHPDVITRQNMVTLFGIEQYLREKLMLPANKIQVLFSENRGVDVGGFFLMLDQVIKQNLQHDYIIKLHSKTHDKWRARLFEILDLDLKHYLPKFDAIYGCQRTCYDGDSRERHIKRLMRPLLKKFKLKRKNFFFFPAGTMFIASNKITQFFKQFNLLELYEELQLGYTKRDCALEHVYERFLGYLIDHLYDNVHYCNKYVDPHFM